MKTLPVLGIAIATLTLIGCTDPSSQTDDSVRAPQVKNEISELDSGSAIAAAAPDIPILPSTSLTAEEMVAETKPLLDESSPQCENPAVFVDQMAYEWDQKTTEKNPNKYEPGYQKRDSGRMIVQQATAVGVGIGDNSSLAIIRNQMYRRAVLRAKSQIIKSLKLNISGSELVEQRPFGLTMDDKIDQLAVELNRDREQTEEKLKEIEASIDRLGVAMVTAENNAFDGVSFIDRLNALIDALNKRLNPDYMSEDIAAEEQARVSSLRAQLESAKAEAALMKRKLEELERALGKYKNMIRSETEVKILASMKLFGIKVLKQFHCFNPETRTYAVLVKAVWSDRLQNEAIAIFKKDYTGTKLGKMSANRYFGSELRKARTPSSGRFRDDKGTLHWWGMRIKDYSGGDVLAIDEQNEALATFYMTTGLVSEINTYVAAREQAATSDAQSLTADSVDFRMMNTVPDIILEGVQTKSWFAKDPYSNQQIRVALARVDYNLALESPSIRAAVKEAAKEIEISQEALRNEDLALPEPEVSAPNGLTESIERLTESASAKLQGKDAKESDPPLKEKEKRKENFGAFESEDVADDF
ncbi:MAG: hypothetical protein CL926_11655 [Deltaproteobacteria bacterium]|nr:hypothetical protein [Deltaproteobacteria bacterium]